MSDRRENEILIVTTTVPSVEQGQRLARLILEQRLAACVQIDAGLSSLYRWEGRLCNEAEARLVIKTMPGCVDGLQALFAAEHPYQLPQFAAARAQASATYADWVRSELAPPS